MDIRLRRRHVTIQVPPVGLDPSRRGQINNKAKEAMKLSKKECLQQTDWRKDDETYFLPANVIVEGTEMSVAVAEGPQDYRSMSPLSASIVR